MIAPAYPQGMPPAYEAPRGFASARVLPQDTTKVNSLVAFMFCVMVASFPIELPERSFRWEVPTITTTLFLMTTFLQPTVVFGRFHAGLVWLGTYVLVFAGSALGHGWRDNIETSQLFLFIVQAMLVAWATFNLMQHDRLARRALWWFAAACVVRTVLPMTGLVQTTNLVESATGAQRVTAFGQDPNYSAMLLSAALLITLGLTFGGNRRSSLYFKLFALGLAGFFAVAIVNSGSRGGLLALVTGLMTIVVRRARNPMDRVRSLIIVAAMMMGLTYIVMTSYVMRKRIETTAEMGAMAGREELFPALWGMFLERPVVGWGPINNSYEVVRRATELILRPEQMGKDAHNLYLELLTSVGLLGAVPFLIAMGLCVRAGWRARDGGFDVLPLAIMGVFVMANISLNQVAHKPFWFFMAVALAAERRLARSASYNA